jgi:hypothetical protein
MAFLKPFGNLRRKHWRKPEALEKLSIALIGLLKVQDRLQQEGQ